MTSKIVVIVATLAIVSLIFAAVTYYYSNYVDLSTGSNVSPSTNLTQLLTPTDQSDLNWAGYSVASNFSNPQPSIIGVSGSWVVPQVQVSSNDTFSAIWVGIGGVFGHTLIQTGTEQDCINGIVYYSAGYELLPSDSVTIPTIDVSPGDTIKAAICLADSAADLWSIYISDLSTGKSFSQNFFYASSRLSAEWIVERPDINNAISDIANFGGVTLSDCMVDINDEIAAFGYFPSIRIFMYDMSGMRLADVSGYGNNGSSFIVSYLAS